MGKVQSVIYQNTISPHVVFPKRVSIEKAESFHIHLRNLRIELGKKNFEIFCTSIIDAYKTYKKGSGKKVPGQTFLAYHNKLDAHEIQHNNKIKVELCENLYKQNKNNIFGKHAAFYKDDSYVHVHIRDSRIELSQNDYQLLVEGLIHAYVHDEKSKPQSLEHLFRTLEKHKVTYVVLRNFSQILKNKWGSHPDIDLLVRPDDIPLFDRVAKSVLTNLETYRVQRRVRVEGRLTPRIMYFDIRTTTDNYFPQSLSEIILKTRKKHSYLFIPDDREYFLSLLYHAHFHKPQVSEDYIHILKNLYKREWFSFDMKKIANISYVATFFENRDIPIVEPYDKSVQFHIPTK